MAITSGQINYILFLLFTPSDSKARELGIKYCGYQTKEEDDFIAWLKENIVDSKRASYFIKCLARYDVDKIREILKEKIINK